MENQISGDSGYIFNVKPISEGEFELEGNRIKVIVFESVKEGDIVKICTEDHVLGIMAEFAWVEYKYRGYYPTSQSQTIIRLNGVDVACDILEIEKGLLIKRKKNIFFDISDFWDNLLKGMSI